MLDDLKDILDENVTKIDPLTTKIAKDIANDPIRGDLIDNLEDFNHPKKCLRSLKWSKKDDLE